MSDLDRFMRRHERAYHLLFRVACLLVPSFFIGTAGRAGDWGQATFWLLLLWFLSSVFNRRRIDLS